MLVVVVLVGVAACTGTQSESLTDWSVFLRWLTEPGGGAIVVGALLSIGYEYIPKLSELLPKWRRLIFFGICLAIPLIGAGLGIWTDGWPATWRETLWPALLTGVIIFGSGTITHTPRLPDAPLPGDADAG